MKRAVAALCAAILLLASMLVSAQADTVSLLENSGLSSNRAATSDSAAGECANPP